jgi:predicted DNA-binding protein
MAIERLSFSYPVEMKAQLQALADRDQRKVSQYIQLVLKDHLDKNPMPESTSSTAQRVVKKEEKVGVMIKKKKKKGSK